MIYFQFFFAISADDDLSFGSISVTVAVAAEYDNCVQYMSLPLASAAANGHADCVRLLLNSGADKEAKSTVRRPNSNGCLIE